MLKKGKNRPSPARPGTNVIFANMAACSSASNKRSVSADVETQRSEIAKLMKKKLVEGDTW